MWLPDSAFLLGHPGGRSPPPQDPWLVHGGERARRSRHTDGPCTLHLALQGESVDIRVTDTSPLPPGPRAPHTDGSGGWGWLLGNQLTTNLHIESAPGGGKTICARILLVVGDQWDVGADGGLGLLVRERLAPEANAAAGCAGTGRPQSL